ncbi:MAG TPA: hypothetical protein DIT88_08995 [Planctomycetaceae bacterium]|nr:hypothetical protein [Planctomycetaceae bacterium]
MQYSLTIRFLTFTAAIVAGLTVNLNQLVAKDSALTPIPKRFASVDGDEIPSFQKHVTPLMGRLGCNGRACHGSFQGRGGFQLSLFGYDFKMDHDALLDEESPRIDTENPLESLILVKPTDEDMHEGGERYKKDSWEYNLFRQWLEAGAPFEQEKIVKLDRLEIVPNEILARGAGEKTHLQVIVHWGDGTSEDVTHLCRYKSSDDLVVTVDQDGLVTSGQRGDTHIIVSYDKAVVPVPVIRPITNKIDKRYPKVATTTKVDELIINKLRKVGIVPSEICSDSEFIRRISLDLTGSLPTAAEVIAFLEDRDSKKREKKINELLERPTYAAWWTTKICDFTGNNDQQLNNTSPVRNQPGQHWYDWIYKRVSDNSGYDQLVSGIVLATSMKDGESYEDYCKRMSNISRGDLSFADQKHMPYYWARRDFRAAPERAISFAYAFMGVRIQCAQCHKHPFDVWSKQDFEEFSSFFTGTIAGNNLPGSAAREDYNKIIKSLGIDKSLRGNQLRRELPAKLNEGMTVPFPVVYNRSPRSGQGANSQVIRQATILGEESVQFEQGQDVREPLMKWLRSPNNRYFASAFVNRVWANYFNVGIVDPPDDMSLGNPPSNKALLDYLSEQFVANNFDMKWLHREILNSDAYQRSWHTNETNKGDLRNFSHSIPRRLPAEVAFDAIKIATASDSHAETMHSEMNGRAISIPTSSERALQSNNGDNFALMVFGRSTRESNCDCDRSEDPTLLQTIFLQNDTSVDQLINRRGEGWLSQVSQTYKLPMPTVAVAQPRNLRKLTKEQVAQRIKGLKRQMSVFKEQGKTEQLNQARQRLNFTLKNYGYLLEDEANVEVDVRSNSDVDFSMLVKQAYLRTLSRYPTDDELTRSLAFVEDAESEMEGLRDVLWALLNTKEFIVNH